MGRTLKYNKNVLTTKNKNLIQQTQACFCILSVLNIFFTIGLKRINMYVLLPVILESITIFFTTHSKITIFTFKITVLQEMSNATVTRAPCSPAGCLAGCAACSPSRAGGHSSCSHARRRVSQCQNGEQRGSRCCYCHILWLNLFLLEKETKL